MTTEEIKAAFSKKKHRAHPEADMQKAVFDYLKAQYPSVVAFAIPNGAKRGKHAQRELKNTGCLKGVPDLFVAQVKYWKEGKSLWDGTLFGLFIELKDSKGKVSKDQIHIIERLVKAGYCSVVCRSFDEAKHVIDNYLKH